jgi:hypothetical protein
LFTALNLTNADPNEPAKWRAMRGLAIKANDHEREQRFFAHEMRANRYLNDWPLHYRLWDNTAWGGIGRWWFGYAYQFLSDFGRSIFRPLAWWAITVAVFTCIYLASHLDHARHAEGRYANNDTWSGYARAIDFTANAAWNGVDCVATDRENVAALKPEIRAGTDAFTQALADVVRQRRCVRRSRWGRGRAADVWLPVRPRIRHAA